MKHVNILHVMSHIWLLPLMVLTLLQHTANDIIEIKRRQDTDTSTWPDVVTNLYMTNFLTGLYNNECLSKLESEDNPIITANAKDQGPKNTTVPNDLAISSTGNMKKSL